ncbi:integrase domain-containing protein [Pseudoduganella sp. UC29_106]|uniref:integrase domain-containing protein n=1 Tax=Pseudoduganella sp. UC29_106 TaxID=3374553 RepID=UPI003756C14E
MANNSQWKAQLSAIIREHNEGHAVRDKDISFNTRDARRQALFRMFALLRSLGFHVAPRNLSARHVAVLMSYWTAQPVAGIESGTGGTRPGWPKMPYSAAYIQQQMSFLRAFARWIDKDGMVKAAERYVGDPGMVRRSYCATEDKGWASHGVDVSDKIVQVRLIDRHVAVQLRMMIAYGLRRKEAVMFSPRAAEVPAYALPAAHPPGGRYISFLRIKRGTKGGRLRFAAVRSDDQREALQEAFAIARGPRGHIGRPGLTLKQSLDLFSNVVRQVGLTKKELGVTPHGLRHQFASDLYFDIAHVKASVLDGQTSVDAAAMRDAYRQVARQLGHNRPQISNAYLGSPRVRRDHASQPTEEGRE